MRSEALFIFSHGAYTIFFLVRFENTTLAIGRRELRWHFRPTRQKIKSLSITNDNYDRTWATLVEYYENQRRIVGSHIAEIFLVKSVKSDTLSEIKRIAREIFNPIARLNSLNRTASLDSDLIVHFALNRLDFNTPREWERHLGECRSTHNGATLGLSSKSNPHSRGN